MFIISRGLRNLRVFKENAALRCFLSSTARQNHGKESKMQYLLLGIPVTAFGLGTWQVQRLSWKKSLIKDMENRTTMEPLSMPDRIEDLDTSSLQYRRIRLRGKFDHSYEFHVLPRSLNEETSSGGLGKKPKTGAHIFTAFVLSGSGERILVNRGWVPMDKIDPEKRKNGQIEDEIELVAFIRKNEKRAPFAPKNNVANNRWHFRDVTTMAEIANCLPIQVDADAGSTLPDGPVGGQTQVRLRNEHLQYIFTWYALSAATAYMFYRLKRKPHSSFG
ncbi:surfeit locus protein 1-like [Actinia tenebrosa]|uniref:SURF1-like protein n=1 Tax=Actinia tenebrosa TaxID=6105 RepID=A0A6P8JDA0_ACTTE|nr:surfeit locus protein 1-like [Actinia tenebrosa]